MIKFTAMLAQTGIILPLRMELKNKKRRCVKMHAFFFYAQSPDFHKLGLCYYLKISYL